MQTALFASLILNFLLIPALLFTNIFANSNTHSTPIIDDHDYIQNVTWPQHIYDPYKLYYGEWVIAEFVAGNSRFGPPSDELIENRIGTVIAMEPGFFSFGNYFEKRPTIYRKAIIPQNSRAYMPFFPNSNALNIDTPFFVFVHTNFSNCEVETEINYFPSISGFFIKDDNTLFLVELLSMYRLERLSHISENLIYEPL